MEHSLPIISDNVTKILLTLYDTSEDDLLSTLATTPQATVLRVNECHPNSHEAINQLKMYLNSLPRKHTYTVTSHPLLRDVLLVTCNHQSSIQPCSEKEVIVDACCGSAVLRGADVFAPGVLAAHPGMKKGDKVSVFADLEKKCRRGLVKHFNGKKFFVGNGVAMYGRQEIFENNCHLKGIGIQITSTRHQLPSFSNLDSSMFFPQNLPSIMVGHILNPQEGNIVLDMCASPGGKTTHIATLLQNKGIVISIDKTQKKVDKIKENCMNLTLSNVQTFCYDSTKLVCESSDPSCLVTNTWKSGPPFPPESFDKILLDPPCSGLGQRPQLRFVKSNKELESYPIYQRKLLKQAISLLKPGGCLVYSTCTLLPQENEEQVAWVLENFPCLKLYQQTPFIGRRGLSGYGLEDKECEKVQRFDWCYCSKTDQAVTVDTSEIVEIDTVQIIHHDTIGFFIAKFIKC